MAPIPSPGSATIVRLVIILFFKLNYFVSGKNILFPELKKRVSAGKIHKGCNGKKLYLGINHLT